MSEKIDRRFDQGNIRIHFSPYPCCCIDLCINDYQAGCKKVIKIGLNQIAPDLLSDLQPHLNKGNYG